MQGFKDCAKEVGVCLLGEVGIQSTSTSILLTFCKIPSSAQEFLTFIL